MTPEQKIDFLDQSKAHFAADMLLKGTYGDERKKKFKGCSVGCHLHHILPDFSPLEISDMENKHANRSGTAGAACIFRLRSSKLQWCKTDCGSILHVTSQVSCVNWITYFRGPTGQMTAE